MKITKAIALADMLAPNKLAAELKVHYLNEVEGMATIEVMMLSTADVPVYTADDLEVEMLVKPPHDKIYVDYLVAMIHFANGEMNKYANTFGKFNDSMAELHRFYFNTFHPADGHMITEGYYISAYGIAVKHGFKGTEKEWLDSLGGSGGGSGGGADGITPHIGANGNWYIGDTDTGVPARGSNGDPGVGIASVVQTVTSTVDGGTNEITVTLTDGTRSKFYVKNGSRGSAGASGGGTGGGSGADGVGISNVQQTVTSTEDGGMNEVTVTLTDGTAYSFYVYNGSKGSPGYTPQKGVDYFDGSPGYTPQKGIDYFDGDDYVLTDADKNEIAELAAELVEVPEGGTSGAGMVLLWENASPQSQFKNQTVNLSGDYTRFLVQLNTSYGNSGIQYGTYLYVSSADSVVGQDDDGYDIVSYNVAVCVHENGNICHRSAMAATSGIYFGAGKMMDSYGTSETNNSVLIPVRIYGIG